MKTLRQIARIPTVVGLTLFLAACVATTTAPPVEARGKSGPIIIQNNRGGNVIEMVQYRNKLAASGRELMLYRVSPGGSCIISSSCLLGHTDYNARGIAETPLTLLALPIPEFSALMVDHAPFRDFVFHLFADRIGELMQLVEEVAFARLDQRLAKLIVARNEATLNVTHQQLADELGSVREIVSRLLKGFASQGLVSLGREQVVVVDRDGLQKLAAV